MSARIFKPFVAAHLYVAFSNAVMANITSTTTLLDFPNFPNFPSELQNMIWEYATQDIEGRLIELQIECVHPNYCSPVGLKEPRLAYEWSEYKTFSRNGIRLQSGSGLYASDGGMQKHTVKEEDGTEIDPTLLRVVIRHPLPGLLVACRGSRIHSLPYYRDIGLGSSINPDRDQILCLRTKLSKTPHGWTGCYEPSMCQFLNGGGPGNVLRRIKYVVTYTESMTTREAAELRYFIWQTFQNAIMATVFCSGPEILEGRI